MNHEELRDQYELYALGVADEPERSEIREHLNRGCEVCMAEMKRARQMSALLGGTVTAAAPSPKLRRRILAATGYEQKRFGWAPFLAAALLLSLFAVFYFSGREWDFAHLAERLDRQLRAQTIELTRLHEAFTILNSPNATVSFFGAGPKGKVFVDPAEGVLLIASNLPAAQPGKTYEMWVIPNGGKGTPIPAGTFQSGAGGSAMHIQRGPVDVSTKPVIAVTLEPESGSAAPTSQPLFAAPVQ
ncbi:MAG TPA: anti-sigma factor [Candidatus Sulfopaludibacter sp.]|jgi:anti-sigma-K factor RskA|nr:anti-sigma factor [Candidatus Sulfopaludibacter sp.]